MADPVDPTSPPAASATDAIAAAQFARIEMQRQSRANYAASAVNDIEVVKQALIILGRPEVLQAVSDMSALAGKISDPVSQSASVIRNWIAQDRNTTQVLSAQANNMQQAIDEAIAAPAPTPTT